MVVRMRQNRSQTRMRRSNHAIHAARAARCECGAARLSHRACPACGKYAGKVVVDVVARAKRDQRRAKRKETELKQSGRATEQKKEEAPVE